MGFLDDFTNPNHVIGSFEVDFVTSSHGLIRTIHTLLYLLAILELIYAVKVLKSCFQLSNLYRFIGWMLDP